MKKVLAVATVMLAYLTCISTTYAGVISSEQVIVQQKNIYNKQQVIAMLSNVDVQNKLVALGVSMEDAEMRIASMTDQELNQLNTQMNDMPAAAGGVVGVVVTVLVVLVVLDLVGVTDVFSFIRPIN
ncbi:PA2779 family protein [Shewanella sp. SR43-4]|mgnify:CR=1 FL=1|jgi:predicted PurR-regulated permease PerM|uniref:PA2779 family protein n=1 Tax=Shewanella vesiculosa TaxID=518738 RepID=A0ABV0FJU1_9GAMM|nr:MULTISPECIES: PA2779 family protein [Shewanella]NCQ45678.1 PA2779 family protein [Shewanella frigidimarina]MBB1317999.1 PA2779 family protein [Shewanella sp. SR43-4]MBB1320325.1 PA2779 family protein [Shewanella sp. SR43-8]MBB1388734.1 PA2779 family protein [Shewanella sp. SG44-6]MBB1474773.1 PA2779 family protein [Shewanella sp. SG41-3]|tara:strand:+ start:2889 stop:3269 length:381 start_codon:yes stop_codon:yes gene_type:complete